MKKYNLNNDQTLNIIKKSTFSKNIAHKLIVQKNEYEQQMHSNHRSNNDI